MAYMLVERPNSKNPTKIAPSKQRSAVPPSYGPPPAPAPDTNYRALYMKFHDVATSESDKRKIAGDLVDIIPTHALESDGPSLAHYMMMLNATEPARRLVRHLAASLDLDLTMSVFPVQTNQAGQLVNAAEQAALTGEHELAFDFLRVAFLYAQMVLIGASDRRAFILQQNNKAASAHRERHRGVDPSKTPPRDPTPMPPADPSTAAIALMAEIFALYPELERHALAQTPPDADRAREYDERSRRLNLDLAFNMLDVADNYQIITAQFEKATNDRGQLGYKIGEGRYEVMTGLPNLKKVEDLDEYSVRNQRLSQVVGNVIAQQLLLAELFDFPSIQAKFGDALQRPDIRQLDVRVEVWRTLWPDLVAGAGPQPSSAPLRSLITLIERFHTVFSVHPIYNIRDFGENYLTNAMPQDLTGRVISDCGVFALTIAYELLEITRAAGLDVDFDIYTSTDHVMLGIEDRDNGQFYIASNNKIAGPFPDSQPRMKEVGTAYANTFEHKNAFIAAMQLPLAESKASRRKSSKSIKADLWKHYITANSWQFAQVSGHPEPTQQYYDDLAAFNALHLQILNTIAPLALELQKPNPNISTSQLEPAVEDGIVMAELYLANQIRPREATSRQARADQQRLKMKEYFVGSTPEGEPNALVELRQVLLDAQAAGVSLPNVAPHDAQRFLDLSDRALQDISITVARDAAIERGAL